MGQISMNDITLLSHPSCAVFYRSFESILRYALQLKMFAESGEKEL